MPHRPHVNSAFPAAHDRIRRRRARRTRDLSRRGGIKTARPGAHFVSRDVTQQSAPVSAEDRFLNAVILIAIGIGTVLWLASFIPVLRVAERSDGMQWIAAFFATPISMVFVLPALVLRFKGGGLNVAALLLLAGAVLAAFVFSG
jgi:hypothetical protein